MILMKNDNTACHTTIHIGKNNTPPKKKFADNRDKTSCWEHVKSQCSKGWDQAKPYILYSHVG